MNHIEQAMGLLEALVPLHLLLEAHASGIPAEAAVGAAAHAAAGGGARLEDYLLTAPAVSAAASGAAPASPIVRTLFGRVPNSAASIAGSGSGSSLAGYDSLALHVRYNKAMPLLPERLRCLLCPYIVDAVDAETTLTPAEAADILASQIAILEAPAAPAVPPPLLPILSHWPPGIATLVVQAAVDQLVENGQCVSKTEPHLLPYIGA